MEVPGVLPTVCIVLFRVPDRPICSRPSPRGKWQFELFLTIYWVTETVLPLGHPVATAAWLESSQQFVTLVLDAPELPLYRETFQVFSHVVTPSSVTPGEAVQVVIGSHAPHDAAGSSRYLDEVPLDGQPRPPRVVRHTGRYRRGEVDSAVPCQRPHRLVWGKVRYLVYSTYVIVHSVEPVIAVRVLLEHDLVLLVGGVEDKSVHFYVGRGPLYAVQAEERNLLHVLHGRGAVYNDGRFVLALHPACSHPLLVVFLLKCTCARQIYPAT